MRALHRDIQGCMQCGSDDLRMPAVRDGALVGTGQDLGRWTCNRCGFTGTPLRFDDQAGRLAYEKERTKSDSAKVPTIGRPDYRPRHSDPDLDAKQP